MLLSLCTYTHSTAVLYAFFRTISNSFFQISSLFDTDARHIFRLEAPHHIWQEHCFLTHAFIDTVRSRNCKLLGTVQYVNLNTLRTVSRSKWAP